MSATPSLSTAPDSELLSGVIGRIQSAAETSSPITGNDLSLAAFHHHFSKPGKCMRAQLCLHASRALGQSEQNAHSFAATVESLHNASLVLDDLQDGTLTRRGQASVCAQFGTDAALALTLQLTSASFLCLSESRSEVFAQLSAQTHFAVSETAMGQARDLTGGHHASVDELKITAALKSGPLFGLALTLPLIAAGYEQLVPTARKVAKLFGLGYQILDDIKDRSNDRLQESDSNIVNAIARRTSPEEAVRVANAEANAILIEAKELAAELPKGSGAGVVWLIQYLETPEV